jgi:hypothetical protein
VNARIPPELPLAKCWIGSSTHNRGAPIGNTALGDDTTGQVIQDNDEETKRQFGMGIQISRMKGEETQNDSRRISSRRKRPTDEIRDILQPNSTTSKQRTRLCKENGERSGIPEPRDGFSSRIRKSFATPSSRVAIFFVGLVLCSSLMMFM